MDEIKAELKEIRKELKHIKESCDRMNSHIDFINGTYSTVRSPFNWFLNKLNTLRGVEHEVQLKTIEPPEEKNASQR